MFVQNGTTYANSTWVLTTGAGEAVGTTLIAFTIFSQPGTVTAANVGGALGQIFRDKISNTLNFKTLNGDAHLTVTNNANTVTLGTTATSENTANAIVARDGTRNFSAGTITATLLGNVTGNVTGSASLNLLLSGGTMSGTIAMGGNNISNAGTIGATTFTGALTGTASGNLALSGGALTGALTVPIGTNANPSFNFAGNTTTGLSANSNNLSLNTSGVERLNVSSSGTVSIKQFTTAGVVHNNTSGNLSSSLIVNADIDATAEISNGKLATITAAGKVLNSATTATSANTANAIVARDGTGNFSAGTITAALLGNVTGNVTGLQFTTGIVGPTAVTSGSTYQLIAGTSIFIMTAESNENITVRLPPSSVTGQRCTLSNTSSRTITLTAVTDAAGGTAAIGTPNTITKTSSATFVFVSGTQWYLA